MSLVLTLMQNLRAKYEPGTLDKNERRRSRYGAWDFYRNQSNLSTGVLTPQVKELIDRSVGNTVQVPVLDAEAVVISNVRACTVADSENTSKLVTLTFVTYSFGFTMTPAAHYNNLISYQADFDVKMEKYLLKFAETLDTAAVSNLSTNKNIYFPAALTSYYPVVANALQVTDAEKDDYFANLEAIQSTMDYYGNVNVVASTSAAPMVNKLRNQGAGNDVNDAWQMAGYDFNYSNRITNGAGVKATIYSVPDGMVGVRNRNDIDAVAGSRTSNGKEWGQVNLPVVNMKVGSYYYEDCADKSALHAGTTHLTRTKVEGFEFSTDLCFVNSYASVPASQYQPILKSEILVP
jgi:hypothetical protein